MIVCLAGLETSLYPENMSLVDDSYKLISYFYARKSKIVQELLSRTSKQIILDSGAFSFLGKNKSRAANVDWDEYVDGYIRFINNNDIKYFMQLDIDNVVGYEKVKAITKRIERETGKQCIPVWHKARGTREYERITKEYGYVAIGGIVSKEIKKEQYTLLTPMINIAHKNGCRVHGLGFTGSDDLHKYHFDSVDSTNWAFGRFGHYWVFDGRTIKMLHRPADKRVANNALIQKYNIEQWKMFQKYAERNL